MYDAKLILKWSYSAVLMAVFAVPYRIPRQIAIVIPPLEKTIVKNEHRIWDFIDTLSLNKRSIFRG